MNKLLFVLSCCLFCSTAKSQNVIPMKNVELQVNDIPKKAVEKKQFYQCNFRIYKGRIITTDNNDYIIIEIKGLKQKELYSKLLHGISKLYQNPNEITTKIEYDAIVLNGYCSNFATINSIMKKGVVGGKYTLNFQFKDGRIRIDSPTIGNCYFEKDIKKEYAYSLHDLTTEVDKYSGSKFATSINNIINVILDAAYGTSNNNDW